MSESGSSITQTCCCLGMVLERKGNFNLFFIHKVKDVGGGVHIFLVLSSCLGKDLGLLLPTHQEMKKKVAHGLESEHMLTSTLFPVRHQRTCWCYWGHTTSVKYFLEHSRGEQLWRRAIGNDESVCNHQLLSLFNSSGLWEG